MATPWIYCCRCGTHDARASYCEKGPHLGKHKTCHGVAGSFPIKRRWAYTTSERLDGFFKSKVETVLAEQPALGVTDTEQLAGELRDEVVPVRAVNTARICQP